MYYILTFIATSHVLLILCMMTYGIVKHIHLIGQERVTFYDWFVVNDKFLEQVAQKEYGHTLDTIPSYLEEEVERCLIIFNRILGVVVVSGFLIMYAHFWDLINITSYRR